MFSAEQDLTNAFLKLAKTFLCQLEDRPVRHYFLVEEFDSQHGIADLVLGTFKKSPGGRKDFSRKSINRNWLRPLINFEKNSILDMAEFMDIYGISKKTAGVVLQEYSAAGFLQPMQGKQYKVLKNYQPITETIISIEAKLRNWKKALQQACRYKRFSNQSYVLLDDHYVKPALRQIDLFKEVNVGLLSMTDAGYNLHFKPQKIEVKNTHSYLRLNETAFDHFKLKWASA
jgi:hypothetical protein